MKRPYPSYNVLDKWESQAFNDATREALNNRLNYVPERRFLTETEWTLLDAIVARLIPQPERQHPIPITPWIDAGLHDGQGEGFRAPGVPRLHEAWLLGLAAIEAEADARFGRGFVELGEDEREARWRKFWAAPPEIDEDLSLEEIEAAGESYWRSNETLALDR